MIRTKKAYRGSPYETWPPILTLVLSERVGTIVSCRFLNMNQAFRSLVWLLRLHKSKDSWACEPHYHSCRHAFTAKILEISPRQISENTGSFPLTWTRCCVCVCGGVSWVSVKKKKQTIFSYLEDGSPAVMLLTVGACAGWIENSPYSLRCSNT